MELDYFSIAKNKLLAHPKKITSYLNGVISPPITLEIQPTEKCNFCCPHCISKSYFETKEHNNMVANGKELNLSLLDKVLRNPPDNVIISGTTGEPLLYSKITNLLDLLHEYKIPVSIITNGSMLTPTIAKSILSSCYNIRISLDSVDCNTFANKHGTTQEMWYKVNKNIFNLVKLKKNMKSTCRIGIGYLTGTKPSNEIEQAVIQSIDRGVDYVDFRPIQNYRKSPISDDLIHYLSSIKSKYESSIFTIWSSHQQYSKISSLSRNYSMCHGSFFYTLICPTGDLFLCCNQVGNPRACYGNLSDVDDWIELLKSPEKKAKSCDLESCKAGCRLNLYNIVLETMLSGSDELSEQTKYTSLKNKEEGSWYAI